jgi:branched-chain amino acid transport system ATP-binding protein
MKALLEVDCIAKSFDGLRAVIEVSFAVDEGRITSLIGPNGAGKTTVFNIISGFLAPDAGKVLFLDQPLNGLKPFEIVRRGVGRTFQDPRIYPDMTVLENVMVGVRQRGEEPFWALVRGSRVQAEWRAARIRADEMLATVGLLERANELAQDLSFGEQRFLSIARTFVGRPRIVLMDEPTVGLDKGALTKLTQLMRQMVSAGRTTILLIEHNMGVVMSVSDKIFLLVQGEVVAAGVPDEIKKHPSMVEAYLGQAHVAASR